MTELEEKLIRCARRVVEAHRRVRDVMASTGLLLADVVQVNRLSPDWEDIILDCLARAILSEDERALLEEARRWVVHGGHLPIRFHDRVREIYARLEMETPF